MSFDHPRRWRSQLQPLGLHYGTIFAFLSNFALRQPCSSSPQSFTCIWKSLGSFPANGLVMTFGTRGYGPGVESGQKLLGPGKPTVIGGRVAHRLVGTGQGCLGTGADGSVSYTVLDGKSQGVFNVELCYRGPDLQRLRSEADRVARSLRLGPGPAGVGVQPS